MRICHLSSDGNDLRLVHLLVESNADLNSTDHKGNTPLLALCERRQDWWSSLDWTCDMLSYLVSQETIQLDKENRNGRTALFSCVIRGWSSREQHSQGLRIPLRKPTSWSIATCRYESQVVVIVAVSIVCGSRGQDSSPFYPFPNCTVHLSLTCNAIHEVITWPSVASTLISALVLALN